MLRRGRRPIDFLANAPVNKISFTIASYATHEAITALRLALGPNKAFVAFIFENDIGEILLVLARR